MDCTGSMGSYIASATNSIRSIVEEIVISEKSDIRLALVEYRDHPPQVRINYRGKKQPFNAYGIYFIRMLPLLHVYMILQQKSKK
jgi:hypothetical protein